MKHTAEIATMTRPGLLAKKQRINNYSKYLFALTLETLKKYFPLFLGEKAPVEKKGALIAKIAAAMAFDNEAAFREWFFGLPPLTQKMFHRLVFDSLVPIQKLEAEFGLPLIQDISAHSWEKKQAFRDNLGLSFLEVRFRFGQAYTLLPDAIQTMFLDWLVPPPELALENCADTDTGDTDTAASPPWDNSAGIDDSLPLLYEAIGDLFTHTKPKDTPYRNIRGFKKKTADELRAASAFKPFPVPGKIPEKEIKASDLVPDSTDLTARFILAMKNFSVTRPKDGQAEVKNLVQTFFAEESKYRGYVNPPDRHSLEFNVLFDHISKNLGYSLNYGGILPASRRTFRSVLEYCAQNGKRFNADKIASLLYRTRQNFTFFPESIDRITKFKAETITVDGLVYSETYYDDFFPGDIIEYYLLTAPLFKAYCYLFAALGVLEITQQAPPLSRTVNEKNRPLSPYDSLKTLKVTELGKWCLGLTEKRPERPKAEYQAIADKELLLVTVQGSSLERTVYLDRIGRKLGPDRWRISPDSFITGCADKKQIEERIHKFKALIDPDPAPHWRALFEKTLNRSGLFDKNVNDMLIYRLPSVQDITEELFRDTELRSLVYRAEKGLLIVPVKNRKKFFTALNKHGIAVFTAD